MPYRWPWKPPPDDDRVRLTSAMDQVSRLQKEATRQARLAERAAIVAVFFAVVSLLCQTFVVLSRWGWF